METMAHARIQASCDRRRIGRSIQYDVCLPLIVSSGASSQRLSRRGGSHNPRPLQHCTPRSVPPDIWFRRTLNTPQIFYCTKRPGQPAALWYSMRDH
jgi:hypothetical protein